MTGLKFLINRTKYLFCLSVVIALIVGLIISFPIQAITLHWSTEIVDELGDVGSYCSLALDSDSDPHISYYDQSTKNLKYASWNGTSWDIEVVDSTDQVGLFTSIALDLDASGNPQISYYDQSNRDLKYAEWNGTSWDIQTVDSTGDVGKYSSLAIDIDGHPHIGYHDKSNNDLKYAEWNGVSWNIQVVDAVGFVGDFTSIALGSDGAGYSHIAYYNDSSNDLKHAEWTGVSWDIETVDSLGDVGQHASIVLDTDDHPRISYLDQTNKDLKYAEWTGTVWNIKIPDVFGNVGEHTSIDLDSNGYPHISYLDDTNKSLKHSEWNGTSWTHEIVDVIGGAYEHTSLKVGSSDDVHIAFYDLNNHFLKYTKGTANDSPVADADGPYVIIEGDDLVLDGSVSSDPDGAWGDSIVLYEWDVNNDSVTDYLGVGPTVPWAVLATYGFNSADPLTGLPNYPITIVVTDSYGLQDSDTTTLTIYTNEPSASLYVNPNQAAYNQSVTLDGSGSSHGHPSYSIVKYEFDFDGDLVYDYTETAILAPDGAFDGMTTNTYTQFGSYTATLRVTDDNSPAKTDIDTEIIDISLGNNPPVADADGPHEIYEGDPLILDGSVSSDPDEAAGDSIVSWQWDIDNDSQFDDATGATPTVPWATLQLLGVSGLGSHTIGLQVTDDQGGLTGTDTTTFTVYTNQPVSSLSVNPNPAAPEQMIAFDGSGSSHPNPAQSIVLYEWDFTYNGVSFNVDATGAIPTPYSYSSFGAYTVALRVTDDNSPAKTDIDTEIIDISLGNNPPVADADGPHEIYEGDPLILDGSVSSDPDEAAGDSIVSWQWDIDNDSQFDDATGATPTVPWATLQLLGVSGLGSHTIGLQVTDDQGGLTGTDTTTFTVYTNQPVSSLSVNPNPAAPGQSVTLDGSGSSHGHPSYSIVKYEFDFDGDLVYDYTETAILAPDGAFDGMTTNTYTQFGSYTATLRVTDDNSPAKIDTDAVTVIIINAPPIANSNGPYSVGEGQGINLDGSTSYDPNEGTGDSIVSWEWDIDNDGFHDDASGSNPSFTWAELGVLGITQTDSPYPISIEVTDGFGATDTDTTTLTIDTVPPDTDHDIDTPIPTGDNGWYKATAPNFSLQPNEIAETYYQWDTTDPQGWILYDDSMPIPEGEHTLYYYSVDTVGSIEDFNDNPPVTYKLDTLLPVDPNVISSSHIVGVESGDQTVDVLISGASDNGSYVDGFAYEWSRNPSTIPNPIKTIEEDVDLVTSPRLSAGTWYFHLSTKDNAGNWTSTVHLGPFDIVPTGIPTGANKNVLVLLALTSIITGGLVILRGRKLTGNVLG